VRESSGVQHSVEFLETERDLCDDIGFVGKVRVISEYYEYDLGVNVCCLGAWCCW